MPLTLRNNESIIADAKFHWSSYLLPVLWIILFGPVLLGTVMADGIPVVILSTLIVVTFAPLLITYLTNRSKRFVVTNQRFYLEMGIISKNVVELPLGKINDVTFRQSFIQRLFGTGTLMVLTGNSHPTIIKNVDKAPSFRELLAQTTSKQIA